MSTIDSIAAIFEEELKKILVEMRDKKGKKPEFFEEHYISMEEFPKLVDFLKKCLSSSDINVETELELLLGGTNSDS